MAPMFRKRQGESNCVAAGRSAGIACSKATPETSSTTRTQPELPLGGAAMNRVKQLGGDYFRHFHETVRIYLKAL